MDIDDNYLRKEYDKLRTKYSNEAYLHIASLFDSVRENYKKQYLSSIRARKMIAKGKIPDPEQSWKPFKGKGFEKLILYIIQKEIEKTGLKAVEGSSLSKKTLEKSLSKVYRNLLIRYGEYSILPDVDLVIYNPKSSKVIAIISAKITLRERIAQTAYWRLKLKQDPITMNIRGLFVTIDEDGDLKQALTRESHPRNRIIVEHDLDGTYELNDVAESSKVKAFPKLVEDLKKLLNAKR